MRTRTTLLGRAAAAVTAAGVALSGALVMTAAPAQAAPKRIETPFAYMGSAFGTRVMLGDPSAGGLSSGRTAWTVLGCTAMAPTRNTNDIASVDIDNTMIRVGAVESEVTSYRRPKRKLYGSRSTTRVAGLELGPADGPRLKFGAFTTVANAFNRNGRFGGDVNIDVLEVDHVGIVESTGPLGEPLAQLLDAIDDGDNQLIEQVLAQAPADGIEIPGLGTIYPAGESRIRKGPRKAVTQAWGFQVLLENGSRVVIGRAYAKIESAHPAGVFAGQAFGLEAKVADGVLNVGRNPNQILPCVGTGGRWRTNTLTRLEGPAGSLSARALTAEVLGNPRRDGSAVARARSSVADVVLGGGAIRIEGVKGQVNVFQNRRGKVTRRNIDGTWVGAIWVDQNGDGVFQTDERHSLEAPGDELRIPGVVFLKAGVRTDLGKRGVRVHALRVELLDRTGLVLHIGTARAKILR